MKHARSPVVLAMRALMVAAWLLAAWCGGGDRDAATARPDPSARAVILIAVDGLRADRFGAHGGAVATPNIDAMAASAARFDWCSAQAPDPAARLNAMRYVLHKLPYSNKDISQIGPLDPLLVGRAHVVYERGERNDHAPIL